MSAEVQCALVALAEKHSIYILSDEVYRLLEHDPADRLPAMADLYSRGISAVTLSKPWGGCGITIGWLAFHRQRQPPEFDGLAVGVCHIVLIGKLRAGT